MSGKNAPAENDGTHPSPEVKRLIYVLETQPPFDEGGRMAPDWWAAYRDLLFDHFVWFMEWWCWRHPDREFPS